MGTTLKINGKVYDPKATNPGQQRLKDVLMSLPADDLYYATELAKKFQFSLTTIQQAKSSLIEEGMCGFVRVRGTNVAAYGSKKAIKLLKQMSGEKQ